MYRDTIKEKRLWQKKLRQCFHPGRVVNLCFIVVMLSSTLLTWREVVVLEQAYISSQSNHLETVANAFDRQLQFYVDKLLFYRNGMRDALKTPLSFEVLQDTLSRFNSLRHEHFWQIELDRRRVLPLNGVSDAFVDASHPLSRDDKLLNNELSAALELGYLLRLSTSSPGMALRMVYVSRSGFYVSTDATRNSMEIVSRYYAYVTSPWFQQQSPQANPTRGVRWFASSPALTDGPNQILTVSIPLDYQHYWYGVLAINFSGLSIAQILANAIDPTVAGEYQLYDRRLNLLSSSESTKISGNKFDQRELAQLAHAIEQKPEGGIRIGSRYVNWQSLDHFDGVLVRVSTLNEGVYGSYGSVSIVLALLWLLFTMMLLASWMVIRRMVSNMYRLQNSLQWQAWHDPLTNLSNRGAFFGRAKNLAKQCEQQGLAFSLLQIDLDYFKSINDRFGHQVGDKVLSHAASLIDSTLRANDVAGRVGGEEFCVVLPAATLHQAVEIAERIRQRINSKEILVSHNTTIRISASFGVSSSQEKGDYDFEQLQLIADKRLYRAKQNGRNQICAGDDDERGQDSLTR